jgi:secreted trypsin-like serine protease
LPEVKKVTLAGYGVTEWWPAESYGEGAGILRRVDDIPMKNAMFSPTEVLLDQTKKKGACHGDSGGPAIVLSGDHYYLFGVTSRGYPPNGMDDCTSQSVYTNILSYMDWIADTAAEFRK